MGRLIEKTLSGIRLCGFSLAGEETVVTAPEHNVCFDVGRAPREVISIDNVCISHGHMDHAAGIAYYFSQRGFVGAPPGRIIIHRGLEQAVHRLMAVWAEFERHPSEGKIVGVEPFEDVLIRRGLLVRPFAVNHGACAMGYSLIEKRHKLKPEFHGKSGPQLVELKKQGVQIEFETEIPLITYTGDTALGRFLDLEFVRQSRVLVLDCTFFERGHLDRARKGRHIHVQDLPQILVAVPDAQIVLMHVTRRTDMRLCRRILEEVIPEDQRVRITFLMDRPPKPGSGPRRKPAQTETKPP